jgi:hypothetical protein
MAAETDEGDAKQKSRGVWENSFNISEFSAKILEEKILSLFLSPLQ